MKELIGNLGPGDEIVITRDQKPVAKLIPQLPVGRRARKAGSAKGKLVVLQEDDEHLKDFEEYMQ